MGLINRLLKKEDSRPREEVASHGAEKETVAREDLPRPAEAGDRPRQTSAQRAASPPPSALAESALQEALGAVQSVVEKARSYAAEIGNLQAKSPPPPAEPAPQPPAPPAQGALMTEASATVLIEYLKHFFDLVSMQNRLLERRLDSLEQLIARLDQHVTEDAADVAARLTTLEGVQLPLVKPDEHAARSQPAETAAPAAPPPSPAAPEATAPKDANAQPAAPAGQPMQGVLRLSGLPSFRSLFAVRDELRRREDVISAEAASFEAGHGELRLKAAQVIHSDEILNVLREATGQEFLALGRMSFEAAAERRRAG